MLYIIMYMYIFKIVKENTNTSFLWDISEYLPWLQLDPVKGEILITRRGAVKVTPADDGAAELWFVSASAW